MNKKIVNMFLTLMISGFVATCSSIPLKNGLDKNIYLSFLYFPRNNSEGLLYPPIKEIKPKKIEMISDKYESCVPNKDRQWNIIVVSTDLELLSEGFKFACDLNDFVEFIDRNGSKMAYVRLEHFFNDDSLAIIDKEGWYQIELFLGSLTFEIYFEDKNNYSNEYSDLKKQAYVTVHQGFDDKADELEDIDPTSFDFADVEDTKSPNITEKGLSRFIMEDYKD